MGASISHMPLAISHQPSAIQGLALMRFIHLYLIGYFVLLVGAALALWQSGVLARVSGMWIAIGAIIAVGLGIMLAVTAGKPTLTRE
jgi:hypothetical protein